MIPIPELFNWVDGLLGQAQHGAMHRFTWSTQSGFSGIAAERLLRRYHVRVWGRQAGLDGECGLLVKHSQAHWAEYLLCRAGVPLTCALLDKRNLQYADAGHTLPPPRSEQGVGAHTIMDRIIDALGGALGEPNDRGTYKRRRR
jgi:hypothetical protein